MGTEKGGAELVWVNGKMRPASEAGISVLSSGASHGMGCFETIGVEYRQLFRFSRHYARLQRGTAILGLELLAVETLKGAILGLVTQNGYQSMACRVRVSCYLADESTTTVISTNPMPQRRPTSSVILSPYRVNEYSPLVGIKSSCYAMNLIALRAAQEQGADEAIMLNSSGELCEGATSNLFLIRNGEVFTPPLKSGCLPGVTRELAIELCDELAISCVQKALTLSDLAEADGAFLTSSIRGIHPISERDGEPVASCEIVHQLQTAYLAKRHGSA